MLIETIDKVKKEMAEMKDDETLSGDEAMKQAHALQELIYRLDIPRHNRWYINSLFDKVDTHTETAIWEIKGRIEKLKAQK